MSIKAKLSFSISIIVAIILILNIIFYSASSKSTEEALMEQRMQTIAKQIGVTIESIKQSSHFMETELGKKLHMASLVVKDRLDPDINNVTEQQLIELSKELQIDDISLWQRTENDIVVKKSSNPEEMNLSSATWDYWHTAFHQLFDNHKVTIPEGQKLPNYWSGPMNFATSNPTKINKWGYYYDGTTNYMINPISSTIDIIEYDYLKGTHSIIEKILAEQPALLEITGFDPEFFGKDPIIKYNQGIEVFNLDIRDISFGQYTYQDKANDEINIRKVLESGQMLTFESKFNDGQVMKSFIPIMADKPYIIGVTFDKDAMQAQLNERVAVHALISLGLVILTMISSYFIAGYMIRSLNQILNKVNTIAAGNFDTMIKIRNKDEFGLLAARVNSMGNNLRNYTTQLKDTASELRSTKQYLESFVNHTSDAIHVVDLNGNITQVNNAFETMFGWPKEEVLGLPLPNVPDEQLAAHEELLAIIRRGGSVTDYETVRYTKAGELIHISITISAIRDEQEEIIAIASISRNITSRKQSEEMIRRSEKLSVVGQLAAGVAHEVRNPLTTLRGFVQLQKKTGTLSPANLDLMLTELDQINMIVSEFLVLAKPQANHFDLLDVNKLVHDIMILLDSEAKLSNVELILQAEQDIPSVYGVANQLKQVFVNVLKNGIEAMPDGGELRIETTSKKNGFVIIRIIDQGDGIAEADLAHLGEPFFTRKPDGSGLGIMVSQQIITNHKGKLTFQSALGQGTCVEITLPVHTPPA